MRKNLTVIAAALLASALAASETVTDNETAAGPLTVDIARPQPSEKKPDEKTAVRDKAHVLSVINEIYAGLEKNYPQLVDRLRKSDEERIISSFVKALGPGLEYRNPVAAESASGETAPPAPKEREIFPLVNIASNKLSYVRIDEFNKNSCDKLRDDLETAARLRNPPAGLIIDLRNCAGFDYSSILRALGLFCPPEKMPGKAAPAGAKMSGVPSAVLIGGRTIGAAEVFAHHMRRAKQGLTIGSETGGLPFPKQSILLSNGKALMIPDEPSGWDYYPSSPEIPAIKADAYPQISYDKLSGGVQSGEKDACLDRAVDLLLGVAALREKLHPADDK